MAELDLTEKTETEQTEAVDISSAASAKATKAETTARKNSTKKKRSRTSNAFLDSLNSPQGKVLTTTVVSLLTIAALFFLAIAPALGSITNQLEINNNLRLRIANLQKKQQSLQYLTNKEIEEAERIEKFNDLFGDDKHQGSIYQELLAAVEASRLTFRSLNFLPLESLSSKYAELSLSPRLATQQARMVAEGDIARLPDLIKRIEENKRILDVLDISANVPDANNQNTVLIEINMVALYWDITAG